MQRGRLIAEVTHVTPTFGSK